MPDHASAYGKAVLRELSRSAANCREAGEIAA
jgi:hypothetical protein